MLKEVFQCSIYLFAISFSYEYLVNLLTIIITHVIKPLSEVSIQPIVLHHFGYHHTAYNDQIHKRERTVVYHHDDVHYIGTIVIDALMRVCLVPRNYTKDCLCETRGQQKSIHEDDCVLVILKV